MVLHRDKGKVVNKHAWKFLSQTVLLYKHMYSSVGTLHFAKISVVVVEVPFSSRKKKLMKSLEAI